MSLGDRNLEPMITIFCVPKPFIGHVGIIQRNAIQSWIHFHPGCEIILCGNEYGTEGVAREFNAKYISNISRNKWGTPLLNSVFDKVGRVASYRLLCYINADIILLSDFMEAVKRIRFRKFLIVGQRWDIDLTRPVDFAQPDWEERLHRYVFECGVLHPPSGSDYFLFPREGAIEKLPPFAVGRPGWDTWFIYRTRKLGIPIVDVTRVITVVHQNHDYTHVPNRRNETWEGQGPEADRNLKLIGGWDYVFTLLDVTHVMTRRALLPALGYKYLRRRWQTLPILYPVTKPLVRFLNKVGAHLILMIYSLNKRLKKRKSQHLLRRQVKRLRAKGDMVKLVIGSGPTSYEGWLTTNLPILDALKSADWSYIFQPGTLDRILAEHVIEHWTEKEFRLFLSIVRSFLSERSLLRIAVPDGFHPDPSYRDYVKLGGRGSGADDHKVLYNYITMSRVLFEEQYNYNLLEYFDEAGQFHRSPWKINDGFVERCADHDPRNKEHPLTYTSLIIDAWPRER